MLDLFRITQSGEQPGPQIEMNNPSFESKDIGSPRLLGSTRQAAGALEIVAGGKDIWGTSDEFHFHFVPVVGDFEMSVQLEALSMADVYTKAGLMVRASLEGGSEHAMLLAFGDNQARNNNNGGLEFQYRTVPNGECVGIYPPRPLLASPDFPVNYPDVWLRVSRRGGVITAECSRDGTRWKSYCEHPQRLPMPCFAGLAVTSHNELRTVSASFRHLRLNGGI